MREFSLKCRTISQSVTSAVSRFIPDITGGQEFAATNVKAYHIWFVACATCLVLFALSLLPPQLPTNLPTATFTPSADLHWHFIHANQLESYELLAAHAKTISAESESNKKRITYAHSLANYLDAIPHILYQDGNIGAAAQLVAEKLSKQSDAIELFVEDVRATFQDLACETCSLLQLCYNTTTTTGPRAERLKEAYMKSLSRFSDAIGKLQYAGGRRGLESGGEYFELAISSVVSETALRRLRNIINTATPDRPLDDRKARKAEAWFREAAIDPRHFTRDLDLPLTDLLTHAMTKLGEGIQDDERMYFFRELEQLKNDLDATLDFLRHHDTHIPDAGDEMTLCQFGHLLDFFGEQGRVQDVPRQKRGFWCPGERDI